MKIFWLSFCDCDRPAGSQFLGSCVVDVTQDEADDALLELLLRFPHAQEDAEWIAAAIRKAHALGCNPGGEVASLEMPKDHPASTFYPRGTLLDKTMIERLDGEIKKALA